MKDSDLKNSGVAVREPISGIVTARTCECCGHHEIGMTTTDGRFIAFRPGQRVTLSPQTDQKK